MPDTNAAKEPRSYHVVCNGEGQYSIFPQGREVPDGWEQVGVSGPEEECLRYIESVWHDLTPRSARTFRS